MTMNLKELPDEIKAAAEASVKHIPVGATPMNDSQLPPLDGRNLPPITGAMALEMSADGMVETGKPSPPITGDMAVTEPKDALARRPRKPLRLPATK